MMSPLVGERKKKQFPSYEMIQHSLTKYVPYNACFLRTYRKYTYT